MKKVIKINRETKLSEKNVNGIYYEQTTLKEAIKVFLDNETHTNNVTELYTGEYDMDNIDFYVIHPETVIGRCVDIQDDYIEIELLDYDSFTAKFKDPIAMIRTEGERIDNVCVKIKRIVAVDIKERPIV